MSALMYIFTDIEPDTRITPNCTVPRASVQVGVAVTLAGVRVVSGRVENRQGTWRSSRRFLQGLAMFLTLPRGLRRRRPLGIGASGMHGELLVEIAMLATSLGLVVPVLADAVVLHHPLGVLTVACASAV